MLVCVLVYLRVCLCGCEWVDVFVNVDMNAGVCVYLYKLVYRYVCNMCDGDIPYKSINVTLVHVYGCMQV